MSMEEESELKHFLKVVRPDWSLPRKKGQSDIQKACEKLRDIGVTDVPDLLHRVATNTINDDLSKARKPRFNRETIQSIRKQGAFWHSLNHLNEPSFRQVGLFAPVPQMMADRNLRTEALRSRGSSRNVILHPVGGITSRDAGSLRSSANACSSAGTQSPRIRPSSMALSIPTSDHLEESIKEIDYGASTLPRLRGCDTSHTAWKRSNMASSWSCPQIAGLNDRSLPSNASFAERLSTASESSFRSIPRYPSEASRPATSFVNDDGSHLSMPPLSRQPTEAAYEDDAELKHKAERWNEIGSAMASTALTPGWSSYQDTTALQHGEAMLKEQEHLHHKRAIYQQIALEGRDSIMRKHLAKKIEARMVEEKIRESQTSHEVQQSCMSIRKDINALSNARKNLNALRLATQHSLFPTRQHGCTIGLSLDYFAKAKANCPEESMATS